MSWLVLLALVLAVVATVLVMRGRTAAARRRQTEQPEAPAEERRRARRQGRRWPPPSVPPGEGRVGEMKVGGRLRSYLFHRPEGIGIGTPPPLVMVFHGGFGNPLSFARRTGFSDAADRHGFAVAYPAAFNHWADGRESTGLDYADIDFVIKLVSHLLRNERIDGQRVYAVGASNGGMFVFRLIFEVPQLFAAFSVNMAAMPTPLAREAKPGSPVPLMMVNAVHDGLMPWQGGCAGRDLGVGGTVIGVEETLAFWQQRNRCGAPQMTPWWLAAMDRKAAAELYDFPAAADGARLRFLKLLVGGHDWPRAPLLRPGSADGAMVTMMVTDMIWEFLSLHGLGDSAGRTRLEARQHGGFEGH